MFAANSFLQFVCLFQFKEANPQQLMDSKLRCVFEAGTEEESNTQATSESTATTAAPADSSGAPADSAEAPLTPKSGVTTKTVSAAYHKEEMTKANDTIKALRAKNSELRQEILREKVRYFMLHLVLTSSLNGLPLCAWLLYVRTPRKDITLASSISVL